MVMDIAPFQIDILKNILVSAIDRSAASPFLSIMGQRNLKRYLFADYRITPADERHTVPR
jgi:hypothetical protein